MLNRSKLITLVDDIPCPKLRGFKLESKECCHDIDGESVTFIRSVRKLESLYPQIPQQFSASDFTLSAQIANGVTPEFISHPYFIPNFDDTHVIENALSTIDFEASPEIAETPPSSSEVPPSENH